LELRAHLELTPAWREISARLRTLVGESTYDIWLAALEVKDWDGTTLVLDGPTATQGWVSDRYGRALERSVRDVVGATAKVVFAAAPTTTTGPDHGRSTREQTTIPSELNPRYNFDQFVIGRGNRLAHAAALAVAELPGQAYNPLFLHAPPGLGKTHLLHAIGNYVTAFGGGSTVRYTTVEAFTNHFVGALQSKSVERFKHAYRDVDVLLIDDVQFLASKAKTEEEFFHTFNAIYETGRQLVLTCDRLPRQLLGLEERLRERFESGLVADIEPPDFATRLTILRKRAALDQIVPADEGVLELIAERVTDNVRALEGAMIKIVAQHSLTRHPIDLELARRVLDVAHPPPGAPALSAEVIQAKVGAFYELPVSELVSASRKARIAWARQVAIHLTREFTGTPLAAIGQAFGGRTHATVLHACRRVSEQIIQDQQAADELAQIRASLTQSEADRSC
jgi:chromosomal replication initiator protein